MNARKLFHRIHLYLGLVLGVFFLLLAITGSILVFYPEIDLMLHPEMRVQHLPQETNANQSLPIQPVLNQLRAEYPALKDGWRIEMPLKKGFPIFARYLKPDKSSNELFAPLVVSINPYTLQITSARIWGDYFVTWIFDLHYQLLAGEIGKSFVVILGMLLIVNVFIGFYLWLPKSIGAWRHALVYKKSAHFMRKNYDIHKLSGLIGLIFILVLACTGALLGRADWFNPIIQRFSDIDTDVPLPIKAQSLAPISVDSAIAIAKAKYAKAELRWIYTPNTADDYYQIRMHQAGEPGRRFPKTILWVNQYSGEIEHIRNPASFSMADTILAWLHPLHNGEAFGIYGKVLAVLGGFMIVLLVWTGLKRAMYKRQTKRRNDFSFKAPIKNKNKD